MQGKVMGYDISPSREGTVGRVWNRPPGLKISRLLAFSIPHMRDEQWSITLLNPKLSRTDYLGTQKVTYVGQTKDPTTNVYRVDGGLFKNFIVQETKTQNGLKVMLIVTPAMALRSMKLISFIVTRH